MKESNLSNAVFVILGLQITINPLIQEWYLSSFADNQNLKKHVEVVHEGIKPFKCSVCDVKFANKQHLKKHIETIHEEIKPFKCTIRISYCT